MRALLRPNEDSGSQIMEFALVLPLLVVFVVAIYDFGQAFNVPLFYREKCVGNQNRLAKCLPREPVALGRVGLFADQ